MTNQFAQRPIRRMLRRRNSGEYFTGNGWTNNPDEAKVFADSVEAAQACADHRLVDMDIALRVAGAKSELFSAALC